MVKRRISLDENRSQLVDGDRIHGRGKPLHGSSALHKPLIPAGSQRRTTKTPQSVVNSPSEHDATPRPIRTVLLQAGEVQDVGNATLNAEYNGSARKKSYRTLLKSSDVNFGSEADLEDATDEDIAREILGQETDSDDSEKHSVLNTAAPSRHENRRLRGRPKQIRTKRTPSPPPDLPPHESFFFQNRTGVTKTSTATFASHLLLDHDEFVAQIGSSTNTHMLDILRLRQLHQRSFDQWKIELDEGFNICLYGYGSKRSLTMEFLSYLYQRDTESIKTFVVNGYTPTLNIRDTLSALAGVLLPKGLKLPVQPSALVELICLGAIETSKPTRLRLVIHSIDHTNLRRAMAQTFMARLAACPNISLIATCDMPNFPLLWDISLMREFRFLFHDATTFDEYKAETDSSQDVDELLGRGSRRLGGKDGVGYVLKSLPENARLLFRILVAEQLALMDDASFDVTEGWESDMSEGILGTEDEDAAATEQNTPSRRSKTRKKTTSSATSTKIQTRRGGVEYRILYQKSVEEFVCSSELNFRTLLKEFHDHQMIESRKDPMGTERLIAPFRREDLEGILEELV